jgi:hypothetical protein
VSDASSDVSSSDARSDRSSGDAGEASSGDSDITDAGSDSSTPAPPPTLAATGFLKAVGADGGIQLGDGVRPYEPRYKLWSDGADKTRWFYLPPGTKIDNSDQDHWSFPVGAKFWKEFAIGGKRIETRLVQRWGPGKDDFFYATYHWKASDGGAQQMDAELVPGDTNIINANGTDHDVPFEEHCRRCHDPLREHVLGFGAFQLTPATGGPAPLGVTIKTLSNEGLLTNSVPANGFEMPGNTAVIRDALGYLHANCGNCHNDTPGVGLPEPKMVFKVLVAQTNPTQTGAYTTALNVPFTKPDDEITLAYRIFGGDPDKSQVSFRMALRNMTPDIPAHGQMPPLATEKVDMTGVNAVNAWIRTLPAPADK